MQNKWERFGDLLGTIGDPDCSEAADTKTLDGGWDYTQVTLMGCQESIPLMEKSCWRNWKCRR